jgi:hypothetical protein
MAPQLGPLPGSEGPGAPRLVSSLQRKLIARRSIDNVGKI